jgi:branched-chain amino acid transport system substrate-binding protein
VAEEYLAPGTVDFSSVISELVSLDPAAVAGTAPSWLPLFLQEAERAQLRSAIIADGLSWWPGWYQTIGNASDYVLDQVPLWPTAKARTFAQDFETRWGVTPRPYAAGLAYDGTKFFVAAAQTVYDEEGVLTSEALHAFAQDRIWTGQWTFQDGIMVEQYKYTAHTVPDPLVGDGYYTFPIVQYFDGEGKIIFPTSQAEQPFTPPGE